MYIINITFCFAATTSKFVRLARSVGRNKPAQTTIQKPINFDYGKQNTFLSHVSYQGEDTSFFHSLLIYIVLHLFEVICNCLI